MSGSDATAETPTTPESVIFRDDFTDQLNPAWTWQNEDTSRHRVNKEGWLEITGGDESILAGGRQTNLLWIPLSEGDFVISVHLVSQPLFDFQRAGLLLYQDSEHYISLSRGYCMQCVLGGSGVFLEYSLDGNGGRYTSATNANDLYLMLVREREVVNAYYAVEAGQWQHIASLENEIRFERIVLSVTNDTAWNNGYDVVGMFDYLEIQRPAQLPPTPSPGFYEQG